MQRLRAIEDDQEAAVGPQATALQIGEEALTDGRILRRAIPEAECVFAARGIDAERHDDAVLANVDTVDQQGHEIDAIERGRSPGGELRRGLHDEPAAHAALAGAATDHRRRQGFEAAGILPRRHPHQHLLDHAPIQRVFAGHQLKRRQRHFRAVRPHARPTQGHLPTTEHDLARDGTGARGRTLHLMLIALAADRRPIIFEHRLTDSQARGDGEFHQLGARIDEEIDEGQMALCEGIDLVRSIDCARLSFYGGS